MPTSEHVVEIEGVRDYEPGQFYVRELPCIQAVLAELDGQPGLVVIDGYAWLDEHDTPGLGAHLHDALHRQIPVIGVAKNPFRQTAHAATLYRGGSKRPLFVTAAGVPTAEAADKIGAMHGRYRIPSMLRRADQLSRRDGRV